MLVARWELSLSTHPQPPSSGLATTSALQGGSAAREAPCSHHGLSQPEVGLGTEESCSKSQCQRPLQRAAVAPGSWLPATPA